MSDDKPRPTAHWIWRAVRLIFRSRWGIFRLVFASLLVGALTIDHPSRLTRLQIAAMPEFDYAGEVRTLGQAGRYGEAQIVADAGRKVLAGPSLDALEREFQLVSSQRDSYWRRGKDALRGAITGEGDSLEALVGAIAADMVVVGDVRDLLIQGSKRLIDGEADDLVIVLSTVGVLTTVAPQVDWVAAVLKIARKVGSLSANFAEALLRICRRALNHGEYGDLGSVVANMATLSKHASPNGVIRLLRHVDDPHDLARLASFVERNGDGAFALHVAGKEGVQVILKGPVQAAEEALCSMARKGDRGLAWLRSGNVNLLRPHPILGLFKTGWKGTLYKGLQRAVTDYFDPYGAYLLGGAVLWLLAEVFLIMTRLQRVQTRDHYQDRELF